MAAFKVVHTDDPDRYSDQILRFWQKYLPGTPPERFSWLRSGNPSGATIWFLAFEEGSEEIAGTATIMPRRLYWKGDEIQAGILGDFMVDAKYRVFGPNIQLLRSAIDSLEDLGFALLYTVPNDASLKVAERVGIRKIADLQCFARPLDMRFYLGKFLPDPLAVVLSPFAGLFLHLSSPQTYRSSRISVEETATLDNRFIPLWEKIRNEAPGLISDRSPEYLRWRYLQNPLNCFRFLVCGERGKREIGGVAIFCMREERKMDIYDIITLDGKFLSGLIKRLISIGKTEQCQALYFVTTAGNRRFDELRGFRFIDTKDDLFLGCYGQPGVPLESWNFVSGDRNI